MSAESSETKLVGPGTPHFTVEVDDGDVAPWTEVEPDDSCRAGCAVVTKAGPWGECLPSPRPVRTN